VAQVGECLPGKRKILNSIPNTPPMPNKKMDWRLQGPDEMWNIMFLSLTEYFCTKQHRRTRREKQTS
jgi:hypothetical protein